MESHHESTSCMTNAEERPGTPRKRLAGKHSYRFSGFVHQLSGKPHVFATLAFLIGSITCIVLSIVVWEMRAPLHRTLGDINPSCTDFGSSIAEQNLALDLTYGKFTFTQAKVIDVTWDTVIGQGGRLLHGWILYRCIIYPLLVLAMEISTVTYPYYTTLSFSRASFETLVELIKALRLTNSYSILFCTILLIYTLIYTLFFSPVWSAATGYVSLSHKLYAMPGGEIVPLNSEHLSLCWVLDPTRLNLSDPYIEVGPNFSTILSDTGRTSKNNVKSSCLNVTRPDSFLSTKHDLQYGSTGWRVKSASKSIWDIPAVTEGGRSENFKSIQWYAIEQQILQISLNASNWLNYGWKADLTETTVFRDEEGLLPWDSGTSDCQSVSEGFYSSFRSVTVGAPASPAKRDVANIYPYNETSEKAFWSNFLLDESVPLGQGIVPYNSTIRLNDSPIRLDAPFLDVGYGCSSNTGPSSFNSLGNCVCYKGKPISLSLLRDKEAICNTAPGFVWGFSSYLTRLGLILEATWMLCCFVAHSWLVYRSKFLHTEPIKSAKIMRLILDCSEAVRGDIGPDTKNLREVDLVQRLGNIKIGYNPETQDGASTCRIVSGLARDTFSERFHEVRYEVDATIHKRAQRLDTVMENSLPILNRVANSSIHERMNHGLEKGVTVWKSYLPSRKRRPTSDEVYEDVHWRF